MQTAMDEKDLDLQHNVKLDIGSLCSDFSQHSKKSQQSSQRTKTSARPVRSISSRARPIKEYEDQGSKFLSVDLKPGEETGLPVNLEGRSLSRFSHGSTATARLSSMRSSEWQSSLADLDISSRLMSSGLLRPQSSKAYTSLLQNPPKANPKVKRPFKHNTNKSEAANFVVSPGREMSEITVLATSVMNKILREQKPPNVHHVHGRLLKARLKPLDPVLMTSPTIHQCRGIVAETRAYGASSSRTFQRWKSIVSGGHHHHLRQADLDLKESMSMGESIHRTSEVTSPVPSVDLPGEAGPEEEIKKQVDSSLDNFTTKGVPDRIEQEQLTSTQLNVNSGVAEYVCAEPESRSVLDSSMDKVEATMKNAGNKRPFSASLPQDPGDSVDMRPKTAGENVRPKSVRFADENRKLPTDSIGEGGKDQSNVNKGKTSCRPPSEGGLSSDDQDDQDHPGQQDGNRNRQMQRSIATASGGQQRESGIYLSGGKSESTSGTESKEEVGDLTQQHSDDKNSVLGRPKSATVLFEIDSDLSVKVKEAKATVKNVLGVKYVHKNKKLKAEGSKETNDNSNNEIHNSDSLDSQRLKHKGPAESKQDILPNISHFPPKGRKPYGHQNHKNALNKIFAARPASASVYLNKDVVERKSRVSSAGRAAGSTDNQIFAERTNILGRHGMLGKKRPSSAPGYASGHSGITAAPSRSRPRSPYKSKAHVSHVKSKPRKKNLHKCTRKTETCDGASDVDRMWEELPDEDDAFSDDPFMSKFDQLDKELELNRAELSSQTLKYSVQEVVTANMGEVVRDDLETGGPVKIPGIDDVAEDDVEDIPKSNTRVEPDAIVPEVDPAGLEIRATISAFLYKKTNLFVPVSKRGSDKPRLTMNSGTSSKQFRGDETTYGGLYESGDGDPNNVRTLEEECETDVVINNLRKTAASLFNVKQEIDHDDVEAVEKRIDEVRRQLEMDYPHLMKLNKSVVSNELGQAEDDDVKLSHGVRRASDADSLYQGDLYTSLLKAYRCRLSESSQNNSNDEDLDEGIITKSKKVQLHQKAERPAAKCLGRSYWHRSPLSAAKTRPWSGTTNDSGLESDVQSNEDDESHPMADWTSAVTHHPIETVKQEVKKSENGKGNQKTVADFCEGEAKLVSALEIVVEAKKLSKPRKKQHHKDDMSILCHVPPLCFRLNAKPPTGHLFYFAYDQNMSMDRMMAYLGVENPLASFWALLFGFQLVFNMKADVTADLKEVGGFPNLSYNASFSVEGCLYQLTPEQLECLDKFMGYPHKCEHIVLPVWMSNCCSPDELGIAQYCVPACTYIAKDEATWTEPVQPNEFAFAQCVKAADFLTPAYRDHLASFETSKSVPGTAPPTPTPAVLTPPSAQVCVS